MTENKIWARLGVTFHAADEEIVRLQNASESEQDQIFAEIILNALKNGNAELDDEAYSPGDEWDGINPLNIELNTDFGGVRVRSISK